MAAVPSRARPAHGRAARAAVAAVALAVAIGGEAGVGKALAEGGRPVTVAVRGAASNTVGAGANRDAYTAGRAVATVVGHAAVGAAAVADVPQRDVLLGLPARLSPDGAGVDVGYSDAPVTLTLFEDFRCSETLSFENRQGATLADLTARHQVLVRYVLESSLDERLPGPGAVLATNAARAALTHGGFPLFHALLFANQPPESRDGFTVERLLQIASAVPALRGPDFDSEVRETAYRAWVARAQAAYDAAKVHHGTPSMLLNGEEVDLWARPELLGDPQALSDLVEQAAQRSIVARTSTHRAGHPT